MASRKYMSRRNKSKSKGQKRRRTLKRKYGKKRGGFLELFGLSNKKTTSTPSSISGGEEPVAPVQSSEAQVPVPASAPAPEQQPVEEQSAQAPEQQPAPVEGGISGGKRRRRRKSSKKSRKGRKSRKSRRKQRGGCVGFAFQPSVVTPPNSALANPAPIARYTTGP